MSNLSQIRRQKLIEALAKIKLEHNDDDEMLILLNEIENELNSKKYGLIWEEHEEAVDAKMRTHIPVFNEQKDIELSNGSSDKYNFILEGDNLHSLNLLQKTHKNRIDVIYIDPPYNTGNKDFRYDDAFIDKNDLFSHSKWLSFMYKRLELAKNLLSDRGAIFISIDDNEEAALKLLCDEIFSESCFVANISWQRTYSMRNDVKGIASEVEHILVYSRLPMWQPKKLPRTEEMNAKYKNPDNDPRGAWRNIVASAPDSVAHQGMVYAIQNPVTGEYVYPPKGRHWSLGQEQMLSAMNKWCPYELSDIHDEIKRAEICGISPEKVKSEVKGIVLSISLDEAKTIATEIYKEGVLPEFYFSKNGTGALSRKAYINEVGGRPVTNFWPFEETGHTDEASRLLKSMFDGKVVFDTPKPPRLIDRILYIASYDDSIVLDFFAGSGTTGQAVLEYNNKNDDSNRRFILCTNNENNICREVTYERIKRVIEGYDGNKPISANLKYYCTDYVDKYDDCLNDKLLEHIVEMIQLEHGVTIDGEKYILLLSDDEADILSQNWDKYTSIKTLYVSNNVLFTAEQAYLFKDIDINIIPDYYFNYELREVGETW